MALNVWKVVLTDISYKPLAEILDVKELTLGIALSKTDTASFKVRTDNDYADLVQSCDCYVKIYRAGVLVFFGLILTTEETDDGQAGYITATAAGPGWVFPKRIPVKAAAPLVLTGTRANIATQLMAILNTQYAGLYTPGPATTVTQLRSEGQMGISWFGTINAGGSITYGVEPFKSFSEILADLSQTTDGFDWRIVPNENWAAGALAGDTSIGKFMADDPLGSVRPEAIFEFGDGRSNITTYTRTMARDTSANMVTHLLNGAPVTSGGAINSGNNIKRVGDPAYAGVDGVLEDIVQADITSSSLRYDLTNQHVLVRGAGPRQTIVFQPTADYGLDRLPQYGVDYTVGDIIKARARSQGSLRFNGDFRVWGVNFKVDDNGVETPSLTLSDEGS